jgi:aspartate 1-decarboxylase
MQRVLCKSKIHRAKVTMAELYYEGSITLDRNLMDAADLLPYEKVHVLDVNNGNRFETYVIEGKRNTGIVCVNGAAARLVSIGDELIIMAFGYYSEEELKKFKSKIVLVDGKNRPLKKKK